MTKQSDETAQKVVEAWRNLSATLIAYNIEWDYFRCTWADCKKFAPEREAINHKPDCPIGIISDALKPAPIANPGAGWSREKPTEDGYYWYRFVGGAVEPVRISTLRGHQIVTFLGNKNIMRLADLKGRFAGPLTAPPWIEGREGDTDEQM